MSTTLQVPAPDTLRQMNETELLYLYRCHTNLVLKRGVGKERMIELLANKQLPQEEEISDTTNSRKSLQLYVEKNWNSLNSQLPCKGDNRGRCTVYPCPEGRHLDCLLSARPHLAVHGL